MTQAQIIDKYIDRIMIDYPEADKIHIDLVQFAEELQQCNISGDLNCSHDFLVDMFDHFGFPASRVCDKCGYRESV